MVIVTKVLSNEKVSCIISGSLRNDVEELKGLKSLINSDSKLNNIPEFKQYCIDKYGLLKAGMQSYYKYSFANY